MLSVRSTAFAAFAAFALPAAAVTAVRAADASIIITCYAFNGSPAPNNTRCPGSDACCGLDATCFSNRLCHVPRDGKDTFVRGPCAVKPWNRGQCAQICEYDEISGLFPRVISCADGSFCCDEEHTRCCADGKGVFLDANGNVAKSAATAVLSWGPERTSPGYRTMTTTPTATSTTSASSPAVSTPEPSDDGRAAKIGAGVGVPVGVIAIGGIVAFFLLRWRRQKKKQLSAALELDNTQGGPKKVVYTGVPQSAPQEMEGLDNQLRSELAA